MFAKFGWTHLLASTLVLTVAASSLADDVFVKEGVVVKPLSKRKQRKLEKKLLKRPGNEVVIEGTPTPAPAPEVIGGARARRSLRPLFPDRFGRRNDVVVSPSIVTSPGSVIATPKMGTASGDPFVMPGSVEVTPQARVVRPPVISTPKGQSRPMDPTDEPELELEPERPASARILPPPVEDVPPPVISTPRRSSASPAPMPMPSTSPTAPASPGSGSTVPSPDPGPTPTTPPPAPEPEPMVEPPLELPQAPKPA